MPRVKEFDRTDVLKRAMDLFWSQGYEATSVQDLVDAMGINRGSLYGTFGGKHDLFMAAIDHYTDNIVTESLLRLEDGGPVKTLIRRHFERMTNPSLLMPNRGCMMTNSAVERSACDKALAAKVDAHFGRIEDAFTALIARGQATGEVSGRHGPRRLARFLLTNFNGIRVLSKCAGSRDRVADAVEVALSVLDR